MLEILSMNYLLWINLSIPLVLGLYFVLSHHEYSLKEFGIQSLLTVVIITGAFYIGYGFQDITTKSYSTTKVDKFIYEEPWTELVHYTTSYKCGKSTCYSHHTRRDYHPEKYYVTSSEGSSSISEESWTKAKSEFYMRITDTSHTGQVSFGDGKTYTSIPSRNIPFAYYKEDINYIYASKSNIIKSSKYKDLENQYKDELVNYPEITKDKSQFSNPNFNRVINSGLVQELTAKTLQMQLEQLSINRNVNPIIYLTTASSRDFAYVVKGFYKDAHPSDIVLVVGVNAQNSDVISWTSVISLTKSADFLVNSEDISNSFFNIVQQLGNNIDNYYQDVQMKDYKYLAGDIDLPLWYEILIVALNVVGSFLIFRYMFRNEV